MLQRAGLNSNPNSNSDLGVRGESPVVSDGDKPVLSASQVDTWVLCQRKWAWSYIEKLKKSNVFATQGTEIHQVLADWLEKGKLIDVNSAIGKIVMPGMKYLPAPGTPGLEIEKGFALETEVAKYRGFKDMEWFDKSLNLPVIGDHKTTTDFKWAKTEDDLRENTQANIYAYDALRKYNAKEVELRWVYYRTRGAPGSQLVKLRVVESDVFEQMAKIDEIGSEIAYAYKHLAKATDAPPNPTACEAFGGCVYLDNCNLSAQERMRAFMTQVSLTDKLRNRKGPQGDAPASSAAPAATTPASAPPAASTANAEAPAKSAAGQSLQAKIAARATQGVNPPPVQAVRAASPPANETTRNESSPVMTAESGTDASAPKKRGRPTNAEREARAAAAAVTTPSNSEAEAVAESEPEDQNVAPTTSEAPAYHPPLAQDGMRTTERAAAKQADAEALGEKLATLIELARDFKARYGLNVEIRIT